MTDEDLDIILDKMYEQFGTLPNPEHEPKQFAYFVKLFKHLEKR